MQQGRIPMPKGNYRLVLPTAPVRHVTKYNESGHSWYDMNNLPFEDPNRYNESQILESAEYIKQLIHKEAT